MISKLLCKVGIHVWWWPTPAKMVCARPHCGEVYDG